MSLPFIDRVIVFLGSLTVLQVAMALVAVSALMLVVEEQRLSLLPLLLQYLLLGLLMSSEFFRPIVLLRVGLGVAICLILYLTASQMRRAMHIPPPLIPTEGPLWDLNPSSAPRMASLGGMGAFFQIVVLVLGGFVAFGLWRAYPLPDIPAEINLASYWLVTSGLLIILTSTGPLRMGFGLLTLMNAIESLYLFYEHSLLVIGLLGIVDIVVVLGVVVCTEVWLDSLNERGLT
jgi:hypothetical protein